MAGLTRKHTVVPPEAFGPGARFDGNTLHGADGHTYSDLLINREQFAKLCDELGIPAPPLNWPGSVRWPTS